MLCYLDLNENEILKIIRDLNMRKARRRDDISIRMIKIFDKSLLQPLITLFHNSVKSSCYPDIRKRSNIISVHKKSDKQLETTGQFLSYQCFVKFLKILSLIGCIISFWMRNY